MESSDTTVYRVGRSYVRLMRVCAYGYVVGALGTVASETLTSEPDVAIALAGGALFGTMAVVSLLYVRRIAGYTLELSGTGLKQSSPEIAVPWSEITGLREHTIVYRFDVLGATGPTGLRIEYQLENVGEVLDRVLARVPHRPQAAGSRRIARPALWYVIFVIPALILAAASAEAWLARSQPGDALVFSAMSVALLIFAYIAPVTKEIDVSGTALTIRRGGRSVRHELATVSSVDLMVHERWIGNAFSVSARVGEEDFSPSPPLVSAVETYLPLRDALAASRGLNAALGVERFWEIIEHVRPAEDRAWALWDYLCVANLEALSSFRKHYDEQSRRAYRWELWAAAHFMNGGCSSEDFLYFRDWLISEGQDRFERALEAPDSLAELPVVAQATLRAFGEVPIVLFARAGGAVSEGATPPPEPDGEQWSESELAFRLPALAMRYQSGLTPSS